MKNLFLTLITFSFFFGCSPDEDAPTPNTDSPHTGGVTNTTLQDIQGVWFKSYDKQTNSHNGEFVYITTQNDSNCKIELTKTNNINEDFYVMHGDLDLPGCDYPLMNFYSFDSLTNTLYMPFNEYYKIEGVSQDSLHISVLGGALSAGYNSIYSRIKQVFNPSEEVKWEVNLTSSYPNSNELIISIKTDNNLNGVNVPIVPGQLNYSGIINTNTTPHSWVSIKINKAILYDNLTNNIEFSANLDLKGIKAHLPITSYCLSANPSTHPCENNIFFSAVGTETIRIYFNPN